MCPTARVCGEWRYGNWFISGPVHEMNGGSLLGKEGVMCHTAMDNEIALTLKVYQYLHLGNKMEQILKRLTSTIPTGGVIAMWKFITP